MSISVNSVTSSPVADPQVGSAPKSATGFWALFADPQHPEAAPNPAATPTGPVGFWALFADPQHPEATPNPSAPVTGPVGFEALFGSTSATTPANGADADSNSGNAASPAASQVESQLVAQYVQAAQQQISYNVEQPK